jgi:TolB-like protein
MSADPEQEYLADGLTEDIITALSSVPWFFVVSRNSSFTYKGAAVDVREVGRKLGVHYVLEGSVRKSGSRLRVTGQLVDAETAVHLWADRFDGALADVFDLQDAITEAVVDHVLRAMAALNRAQVAEAAGHLDRAIETQPDYARAFAVRAWCHTLQVSWGGSAERAHHFEAGIRLARTAIDVAGLDPEVAAYAGYALAFFGDQVERGMALVRYAIERCPSFAWAHTSIACVTKNGGTLTFFREAGDQTSFGQVTGTNAIPSTTSNAAIGNWNHTTDRNWHGWIDFVYLWDRVLDLGARRAIHNNPWQVVKPRLSGRTYVAYGITAQTPARGDSGKGSIVIAITS